ncbi:hypothetical protein MY04_1018 [Flammeovirga sp. MY04]|uniref:hypothetical protein n=1 Tax=Flammeovirga sp. MY04 TaxID=1191459 RepID=UPI0008061546|nr:hypothetical protein [Flammeovirga sp. MY04]ANQ48397.1 hypothetical protein MY04_1018 [Flammeovirga sp. MY04]
MKYIKYLWGLSLLVYLGLNLLAYIYLPEDGVTVIQQTANSQAVLMTRSDFFYASMGSLLLVNIFFITIGNGILYFPKIMVFAPNKDYWYSTKETREKFVEIVKGWTKGMATILTLILLTVVGVIYQSQGHDPLAFRVEYSPMILWIMAILWLGVYFIVLKKPNSTEA